MTRIGLILPNIAVEFRAGVLKEIRKRINLQMPKIALIMKTKIQVSISDLLKASPEYDSIVNNGSLRAELGLPSATMIEGVIDQWASNIVVKYKNFRIDIGMIEEDFSDVLGLPEAQYIYIGRNLDGSSKVRRIDWLRWLLMEGSDIIVSGFDFTPVIPKGGRSRTGLGVMERDRRGWRVPPEFAGTVNNNFVTRALEDMEAKIDIIARQEITKGLK